MVTTTENLIELQPMLDIASVQALHADFVQRLLSDSPIRIEAQQVERVDACALQLLYTLINAAAAKGVACSWGGISDALRASAKLCGMHDSLGLA